MRRTCSRSELGRTAYRYALTSPTWRTGPSNLEKGVFMPEFNEWDSFYVIVGGAAGALIGLQFVVMTLIAERPPLRAAEAGGAFGTHQNRRQSLIKTWLAEKADSR